MEIVGKWVIKAENDLKIGKDEIVTPNPATDAICFHMQQCVEKYLKAYLVLKGKEFRRTHILGELVQAAMEIDPAMEAINDMKGDSLTIYATVIRYPDDFYMPTVEETEECIGIAESVRNFIRDMLTKSGIKLP